MESEGFLIICGHSTKTYRYMICCSDCKNAVVTVVLEGGGISYKSCIYVYTYIPKSWNTTPWSKTPIDPRWPFLHLKRSPRWKPRFPQRLRGTSKGLHSERKHPRFSSCHRRWIFFGKQEDVSTVEVGDFCCYGFLGRQKFWPPVFLGSRKKKSTNEPSKAPSWWEQPIW